MRIVIVDDHAVVRNGLAQWLSSVSDFEVVGLATNGQEAVEIVCELLPDVVLMDLVMPVLDGVGAITAIKLRAPGVTLIALTASHDPQRVAAALDAGAMGYLLKDVEPEVLAASIRAVVLGGLALSPEIAASLFKAGRSPTAVLGSLTGREQQVLSHIVSGESNKQIAHALGISQKTVKSHCGHIFRTLGVSDRTQAAIWAIRTIAVAPERA
jgi:DNA-binding NarL/FixJ family response regulator